jgi:hypothetical protein
MALELGQMGYAQINYKIEVRANMYLIKKTVGNLVALFIFAD